MRRVYLDEIGCVSRWDNNWKNKSDRLFTKIGYFFDRHFRSYPEWRHNGVCSLQTYSVEPTVAEDIYERIRHYKKVCENTIDLDWERYLQWAVDEPYLRQLLGKNPEDTTYTENEILQALFELAEYILGDETKIKVYGRHKKQKAEAVKQRLLNNKYRQKYGVAFEDIYTIDIELEQQLYTEFWKMWMVTRHMYGW